jgi:phage/plasmid-like protein (TIGR03299 family)
MAYAYKEGEEGWNNPYAHPWHFRMTGDRSVAVDNNMSVQKMMKAAKLDWTVKRAPMFAEIDGEMVPTGEEKLYRSSDKKILTQATENWFDVQPRAFVEFFHDFCVEGSMEMNTMGSLNEGKMLFALAKVDESFSLFRGKDVIESYFLFANPIQYGKATNYRFTPTRVVCQNTLSLALKGTNKDLSLSVNHRKPFSPDEVKDALGIAKDQLGSYAEAARHLSKKRWTVDALRRYYEEVFPTTYLSKKLLDEGKPPKKVRLALEAVDEQPGAELGEGSWWQAYNAATYVVDHKLGKADTSRLSNAWFGEGQKTKIRALNKALEYADA